MKKWLSACFLCSVLLFPLSGFASDNDVSTLDDMVITGSRFKQKNEELPAQITVITAEDIRESGAQSVPDALKNIGGIVITDLSGNGQNQKVDMGGFGETGDRHVAVVVDGRKINSVDLAATSFISVPIENVERIEVLHGGHSVLYGSDAMGGVINIITKDAQMGVHGNVEMGAGSFKTYKKTASVNVGMDRFEFIVGGTLYNTDGYRDRSESDRSSAYGQATFHATDTLSFSLDANYTDADYELPGSLTKAQMEQDRRQSTKAADYGDSEEASYVLGMDSDWGQLGRLKLDLSYRNYDRQSRMESWGNVYYNTYDLETLGFNPQYVLSKPVFGLGNRLTLGVEAYDTDYDRWNGTNPDLSTQTHFFHDQRSMGVYVQDELTLWDNLVINAGFRYEDFHTTLDSSASAATEIEEDETAWNLGVSYIFASGSKAYARIYQAFRFPRVDEFMDYMGNVNQNLKHETARGGDVGTRFVGMDGALTFDARIFLFDVDDEIAYNGPTSQNENMVETRHQGGEINIEYLLTDVVRLYSGLGYTNAEQSTGVHDGKTIPLVPEFKGNLGVELMFDFGLTYRVQYNRLGSRYAGGDEANANDKLEAANTIDMYASYTYKEVEFFLNATNIFNEEDADVYYGGYYPIPEASYYGGVRFSF